MRARGWRIDIPQQFAASLRHLIISHASLIVHGNKLDGESFEQSMHCSQGFFRGEKPDVLRKTRCIAQQTAAPCRATKEALHDLRLDSRRFVRLSLHRRMERMG